MQRTDEFRRLVELYEDVDGIDDSSNLKNKANKNMDNFDNSNMMSRYAIEAARISHYLNENELLVAKMDKLSVRREFSNDPISAMASTSELFQRKTSLIQINMKRMTSMMTGDNQNNNQSNTQFMTHWKFILSSLQNRLSKQLETFQSAAKAHSTHVKLRQKRVEKFCAKSNNNYGSSNNGNSNSNSNSNSDCSSRSMNHNGNYAMFNDFTPLANNELRKRGGVLTSNTTHKSSSSSSSSSRSSGHTTANPFAHDNTPSQTLSYMPKTSNQSRMQAAEKVEQSIAQLGSLFTQMASLVVTQGEVVMRIEDDVEAGLANVEQGHEEMTKFYDITKGNRSLIIKILALLLFFILLFLWWT